ncbi:hypothetical protein [Enterococcus sp. AZ177]|uniref:hypothetical protein n=1 Tax=unclassified Enterococcus TaxID=2608891 RepID=UPI003D2FFB0E
MKKVVYGFIFIAVFGLTACGNDKKETSSSSKVEQSESRVKNSESSSSAEVEESSKKEVKVSGTSHEKTVIVSENIDPAEYVDGNKNNGLQSSDFYSNFKNLNISSTDPKIKEIAKIVADDMVESATMSIGNTSPFTIKVFASDNSETPVCEISGNLNDFDPSEVTSVTYPLLNE